MHNIRDKDTVVNAIPGQNQLKPLCYLFFLSVFSFTNIYDSQDSRGRGRVSIYLLSTTSTHFTDT